VTGKYRAIKKQNEADATQCKLRDQAARQKQIDLQLRERRQLQHEFRVVRHQHGIQINKLNRDMGEYLKLSPDDQVKTLERKTRKKVVRPLPRHRY
jgi:phage-related minor tail protein